MAPKITIVMPSYNKVNYISLTVDSILKQSYTNYELIIQDGGSTDGTLEILKKLQADYPKKIKLQSKADGGQLEAIKKGLSGATGEILTFINADDCYLPGALEAVAQTYQSHPNSLWFTGRGIVINANGHEIASIVTKYKNLLLNLNNYFWLLSNNYLIQPSVFFTREAYEKYGPFTGTGDFIMEYDFWLRLGSIEMPTLVNKTLSCFRIESNTKTKLMFKKILTEDEKILRRHTNNRIAILLHKLNNVGRYFIARLV